MSSKFLVTGATGATGGKTVKLLLDAGTQVKAYVHRQDERSATLETLGAQLVVGDLLDFEAVRKALEGVQRISSTRSCLASIRRQRTSLKRRRKQVRPQL